MEGNDKSDLEDEDLSGGVHRRLATARQTDIN
jgi:hypothetical protein